MIYKCLTVKAELKQIVCYQLVEKGVLMSQIKAVKKADVAGGAAAFVVEVVDVYPLLMLNQTRSLILIKVCLPRLFA